MKLNNQQRAIAIGQLQAGRREEDVAQRFGVHVKTIRRLLVRYQQTNDVKDRQRAGCPRITSRQDDTFIRVTALRNRFKTANDLNVDLQNARNPGRRRVSNQTIRRRLHERGIRARRPVVKQKLTAVHKVRRLQWSRAHAVWRLAQWTNVLFSDEVRLCLCHIDGRRRVWRRRGEEHEEQCVQQKTAFGGGSIMFWAGISVTGKTQLVRINGNLNAQRYINEVLNPHVIPFAQQAGPNFIFQQDNARPHTANVVTTHLQQNAITVLDWPAASPDLSPIEHCWDQLKRAVYRDVNVITTLAQLEATAVREWQALPMHKIRRLIRSMTSRVRECINANGSYTHY